MRARIYPVDNRCTADIAVRQAISAIDGISRNMAQPLSEAVREAAYNAVDWGGGGTVRTESRDGRRQIVISDGGPGIHATMSGSYPDLSELEAVTRAMLPGVSGSGDAFRGYGLWSVANVSHYGLVVSVESGSSAVVLCDGSAEPCSRSSSGSRGTTVRISWAC